MKRSIINGCAAIALVAGLSTAAQAADRGHVVISAQERLNQMGYYAGPIDGVMGTQTKAAVMDFQARNGLVATGTLTPETFSLLGDNRRYAYYGHNQYYAQNGIAPAYG